MEALETSTPEGAKNAATIAQAREHAAFVGLLAQDPDSLTVLLRLTERAHKAHEVNLGYPDPDWPAWYAGYMANYFQTLRNGR